MREEHSIHSSLEVGVTLSIFTEPELRGGLLLLFVACKYGRRRINSTVGRDGNRTDIFGGSFCSSPPLRGGGVVWVTVAREATGL